MGAAELEIALRRLLSVQERLTMTVAHTHITEYRYHGRTHQYLWNQYFIEFPEQVTLDYGSSIVVNLSPHSVSPRSFVVDPRTGLLHSVLFQRSICFVHAN